MPKPLPLAILKAKVDKKRMELRHAIDVAFPVGANIIVYQSNRTLRGVVHFLPFSGEDVAFRMASGKVHHRHFSYCSIQQQ